MLQTKLMANATNLEVNIEIDVLTAGTTAEVINAVLEFLLYQRNQIPFVYKTFKYYVNKWDEDEHNSPVNENLNDNILSNFNIERQREFAKQTKKSISAMRKLINEVLNQNIVRSLRFLFGRTILTPMESYTIHIPNSIISRIHSHENHRIPQARLNQTLITLLTNEELYTIFSRNLCSTNVFLELEMCDSLALSDGNNKANAFPKDFCELPPNCKNVHIHLTHSKPLVEKEDNRLQCCKELQIFGDLSNMSLRKCNESNEARNKAENFSALELVWWEAETVVRGFKETIIKGLNIWTNKCQ